MPNRKVITTPESGRIQIYGSDSKLPIQVDDYGNLNVSITNIAQISGAVELTGDPRVSISGVDVEDGAFTVTGVIDLAPEAMVTITGTPTVLIDQPVEVEGTVSISGIDPIDGALPIEITGVTLVNGALPFDLSSRSATSIVTVLSEVATGVTTLTDGYDVSQFSDFSFFVIADNPEVQATTYSYPTVDTSSFATQSSVTRTLEATLDGNYYTGIYTSNYYADYCMAAVVALTGTANVTVYLQGIY